MKKMTLGVIGVLLLVNLTSGAEEDKPFPGAYHLVGSAADLLAGDKIVIEEYISPLCAACFLFFREMKQPLGDDVEVKYQYVFYPNEGREPIRLLILAHLVKPTVEKELLVSLFDANFNKKAPINDSEVLGALANLFGLADQWNDAAWQQKVEATMQDMDKDFADRGGPPKTPQLVINGAIVTSPGIAGVDGDELPAILQKLLDDLRAYRKEHKK